MVATARALRPPQRIPSRPTRAADEQESGTCRLYSAAATAGAIRPRSHISTRSSWRAATWARETCTGRTSEPRSADRQAEREKLAIDHPVAQAGDGAKAGPPGERRQPLVHPPAVARFDRGQAVAQDHPVDERRRSAPLALRASQTVSA